MSRELKTPAIIHPGYDQKIAALDKAGNRTFYDGEKPVLEYNGAGTLVAKNLYGKGVDEILMRTDYTFNPVVTYYLQQDHEGSVTHLTDVNGAVIERYRYDVFGGPTIYPPPAAGPTPTPRQASAYYVREGHADC